MAKDEWNDGVYPNSRLRPEFLEPTIPDAESILDEIGDHRTGPDPTGVARGLRASLDELRQPLVLLLAQ